MVLSASGISKSYGNQQVLRGVTLAVGYREKIALVGHNGSGKTTFLRIIAGLEEPDAGSVARAGRTSITFRPQEHAVDDSLTIMQEMHRAWGNLADIEREMDELAAQMAEHHEDDSLSVRFAELSARYDAAGGSKWVHESEKILAGLGLSKLGDAKISQLSGGEKTKLSLARLLASEFDLLILDEPSNHLDIDATLWLEDYLVNYPKSVLLVSHDRALLTAVAQKVAEIENGKLSLYNGGVDFWLEERELRKEQARAAWERREALVKKELEFIRRNIEGQKTKLAQSRRKMLGRLRPIEKVTEQKVCEFPIHARSRSGELVVRAEKLAFGWGEKTLFSNLDFEVVRGEKIGIVGPNGCGKTTLLKLISGKENPTGGTLRIGNSVTFSLFDQQFSDMTPKETPFEIIGRVIENPSDQGVRDVLGAFGFSGLAVDKSLTALSGGEKTRLALLKVVLSGTNLILLDEPTNHLDLETIESLMESLAEYDGTLIVVSHDRDFLAAICDKFLVFTPEPKMLYGTIAFIDWLNGRKRELFGRGQPKGDAAASKEEEYRRRRAAANELKKYERMLADKEAEALKLEERKKALEAEMAATGEDYRKCAELAIEHRVVGDSVDAAILRMCELEEEILRLRSDTRQ